MVSTGTVTFIAITVLLVGTVDGLFLTRRYIKGYLEKNPPVNEDMLRSIMMLVG